MKKLILITLLNLFSFSSLAENNFYLKGGLGLNNLPNTYSPHPLEGLIKVKNLFPSINLGIGYELVDGYRFDLMLDYYSNFSQTINRVYPETDEYSVIDVPTTIDTKISDLILSVYKSIPIASNTTVFGTMGAGVSSIKDESNQLLCNGEIIPVKTSYGKHVYRFAYKFGVGVDYQFNNTITGEFGYNYYNLGRSKPRSASSPVEGDTVLENNITPRSFIFHNLMIGMRVAI